MKIELCAGSIEAIKLAKELPIDRIELCQNLEQGGMTPSPGLIDYALAYGIETHVLIRPRPGGFIYDQDEIEIMLRNILECKELGAHGVVVGALNEYNMINESAIKMFREKAEHLELTFHRAFDDTQDYKKSMENLIDLGVDRVLSSGLGSNVELGMSNLTKMKEFANERIEVMPGGGVNSNNARRIIETVRPDAIHFSGTNRYQLDEDSMFSESILRINRSKVEHLLDEIRQSDNL
jgi:copper homeostasis protein